MARSLFNSLDKARSRHSYMTELRRSKICFGKTQNYKAQTPAYPAFHGRPGGRNRLVLQMAAACAMSSFMYTLDLLSNFRDGGVFFGGARENAQVAGMSPGERYGAQHWEEYTWFRFQEDYS
jgi:hypothetical protein